MQADKPSISKKIKKNDSAKKKRVKRACIHCKKAKTSCCEYRPCERCVRLNIADTCLDLPPTTITNEGDKKHKNTLSLLIY